MASILKALEYHPHSVGYLSQCFQRAAQTLPSTLVIPSKKFGLYLSDEIFALHAPILLTIDARSPPILRIELAAERSAETWNTPVEALANHHCVTLGMASDRGLGLVAGYPAACDMAWWVVDYVHAFRDLCEVLHHLERKASTAIDQEYDAARKFDRAKSEANLHKRLHHYDTAHDACEQAIALYDHLALLLHLLREAWHLCSPHGTLRTREGVRAELTLLVAMLAALACAAIIKTLKPMHTPIDALVAPWAHAEALEAERRAVGPHEAWEFLVLAWHHDHLFSQAGTKPKRYPQRERAFWLACAPGLLGDPFDPLKPWVCDKLDAIVRASSLVEMVKALIRPSLNSCKGQITQDALNLILFSHNHPRYKSGKRQGQAPIELLTGKSFEAPWWELLLQQLNTELDATDHGVRPLSPPLQLVVNDDERPDRQVMVPGQAHLESTDASEKDRLQPHAEAA